MKPITDGMYFHVLELRPEGPYTKPEKIRMFFRKKGRQEPRKYLPASDACSSSADAVPQEEEISDSLWIAYNASGNPVLISREETPTFDEFDVEWDSWKKHFLYSDEGKIHLTVMRGGMRIDSVKDYLDLAVADAALKKWTDRLGFSGEDVIWVGKGSQEEALLPDADDASDLYDYGILPDEIIQMREKIRRFINEKAQAQEIPEDQEMQMSGGRKVSEIEIIESPGFIQSWKGENG